MADLNYDLRCKLHEVLEPIFDGLRFEIDWGCYQNLRFVVWGSSEDLVRHGLVSAADIAKVPKCGVSHAIDAIWSLKRLKGGWRADLGTTGVAAQRLMELLTAKLPYLPELLERLEKLRIAHLSARDEVTERAIKSATEGTLRAGAVGRKQRLVTWRARGNVIAPSWDAIKAEARLS